MTLLLLTNSTPLRDKLPAILAPYDCALTLDPAQPADLAILDLDSHPSSDSASSTRVLTIGSDYRADLPKPFSIADLSDRLCMLASDSHGRAEHLRAADLHLDSIRRTVRRGPVRIDLAPREFTVLQHLLRHSGSTLSRADLLAHAWPYDYSGPESTVDVCIRRLRAKVDDHWSHALIQTVRGSGYRISAPYPR